MSDRYLPVATFALLQEAKMAVNLLAAAGIGAMLEGEQTGSVFAGLTGMGDQIRVLVPADDAARAAALVADAQGGTLDDSWEDEAERTAVCTICGGALAEGDAACPACQSPRDGIRA
ncbi:MAG: putative signal transducing protein [Gemmataceae bacterium]